MIVFSVVIPMTCADETLQRCLEHMFKAVGQRADVEVIVVDNRPGKGNRERLASWGGWVRIVSEGRQGSYVARNAGVKAAHGQYVLFCDADCFVDVNWFKALVAAAENAAVVCGTYIIYNPRTWTEFFQSRLTRRWYAISDGFKASTAIIKKELLVSMGCFDERFSFSGDIDLGLRLNDKGVRIELCHEAVSRHRPRKTLMDIARQYVRYGFGNACVVSKWGKTSPGFMREGWRKAISACYHGARYFYFLLSGFRTDRSGRKRLWSLFLWVVDSAYFLGFLKGWVSCSLSPISAQVNAPVSC